MKRFLLTTALLISSPAWAATANVDGTLHDKAGAVLANTQVKLQNGQGVVVKIATSDAQGHYKFTGVAAGSYVLLATQKDAVLGSTHLSVAGAEDLHKDLNLSDDQTMNIVIGQRLEARNDLSPRTGTSAYTINQQSIEALPQGADTPLDKVLLQTPGVAEDSAASGSLHIRGEHADVQYRLNGILLPDGISGFGDTIDSHIIASATLLDGVLPAQYGFRTAGVVDIDTKTGFENGGSASLMGGSNGTLQASVDYAGTANDANYFVSATHLSSDLGIENPTPAANAIHDHTEQNKQFGYADYMINPYQRLEMAAGDAISYFQIPNNPNQTPQFSITGVATPIPEASTSASSRAINSSPPRGKAAMTEVTVQIAPYVRNSETHFRPDVDGDLIYNGLASDVQYTDLATGLQNDNSWRINGEHTLRGGFTVQNDHVQSDATSYALTNASGDTVVSSPIVNDHTKDGQLYGTYLQDEWKLTDALTMNYGARFDDMEQYVSANQLSPRIAFVYKATDTTTLHAGYARYFTPPPMELISTSDIAAFANTTGAQTGADSPVKPERSNSFDIGATQKIGTHWEIGNDAYYKLVHDMLDEGQFGTALILTPFNYEHGYIYGDEVTATYTGDKLKGYGNFAFSRAMGEDVSSAQFNFSPAELAYISNNYVHLDHDQTYTLSGGVTYDVLENTTLGSDMHAGSGLRDGFANTSHLPPYATLDLSAEQKLDLMPHDQTAIRLSVTNIMNSAYELRNGTGIGVGAPQWGARRGVFLALVQKF